MMRKIIFILTIALVAQLKLSAQASFAELENNKVIYPSPTAAGLGKYGEYPVNLYNGLVNIGQDIVTVNSGHLALNISLSYHASGNKPSDIPGWVGLGFSLNAGGVITRIIKDLPDDLTGGFYNSNDAVKYLWNTFPKSDFVEQYFSGMIDPRSDVYQFNFCGKTGEFVFDWDRNIYFKQKVPFKVEVLGGTGGFGGFAITTDDGTIYTFNLAEHSQGTVMSINPPISSWYLTKIKNLSGDSIVLKYTEPAGKYRYKQYSTRKEVIGSASGAMLMTGPSINFNTSMDEVVYLDEVDFNNGKLVFGKSKREDPYFIPAGINPSYAEEKKLSLITLKDNSNNVVKQWKFEYFENNTERLKLKNFIAQSRDQSDVQKYSFSYNFLKLPLPFPGPNPSNPYFSNNVDYWGYYNNATNDDNKIPKMYVSEYNQYVGSANREINTALAQAEMLEKITYPTGGYTVFQYEPNDYSSQGESFAKDQNPLTTTTGSGINGYAFLYDRDNGGFEEDPATLSFTVTKPTHININYACGADGPQHDWANPGTMYNYDYTAAPGTYTVQSLLQTDKLLLPSNADITKAHGTVTVYSTEGTVIPINAKTGPGLRIKSIENNDGISSTMKRSFEYKIVKNSPISSGFLSVFPAFYAPLQKFASNLNGLYITSEPINDVSDGAPIGYSRVVERFLDNSYIEHNYTTYGDYPDEMMPFISDGLGPFDKKLAHMTPNGFWRGLETSTNFYNANSVIQKEITNSYKVLPESQTNVQAIELKPTVGIMEYFGGPVNNINGTLESVYYTHSCFLYNETRTEEIFDKDGANGITTSVTKYYDNVKHLQPTRIETAASDGAVITTATSFPDDFAPGVPFIDYMQTKHLTSFPVEQVTYKQTGEGNKIVGGSIIKYKTEGAGLAEQLLKLETANPVSQANFKFSNRTTGVLPPSSSLTQYSPDTHYQPVLTYSRYDNKGNPLELIKHDGIKTVYLWGYNQQLPLAEIVGTDYTNASPVINQLLLNNAQSYTDQQVRDELNKLRSISGTFVTTYTYLPLVGMTSQTDANNVITYYEYDNFNRLKNIKDFEGSILKNFQYNYKSTCGDNCYVLSLQTLNGNTPVSYPVGVFNVNGLLLGNAANPTNYVSLWNSHSANRLLGTLSVGNDSMHFNFTPTSGKTPPPAVTGCRYYQFDIDYTNIDGILNRYGAYVDWGDGTGMKLGKYSLDTMVTLSPNTTMNFTNPNDPWNAAYRPYYVHTYPNNNVKTITIYHDDANEVTALDNIFAPATSLTKVKNLRGNISQNTIYFGGSCFQQSTMSSIANITNWSSIKSIVQFGMNPGDNLNGWKNVGYPQDFMANQLDLIKLSVSFGHAYDSGVEDSTFKISRLKSNWNTYFTKLQSLTTNNDYWNQEDLSALKNLNYIFIIAGTKYHNNTPTNNPIVPLTPQLMDNVIIQVSAGAGQQVTNGNLIFKSYGTTRTSASNAAFNLLKSKGWSIYIDDILQ